MIPSVLEWLAQRTPRTVMRARLWTKGLACKLNACNPAFVCGCQLGGHMPHAVLFPSRVGLSTTQTGFPHALGLNFSSWDSATHWHSSFSQPSFVVYALHVLAALSVFWGWVVSQKHDASLQHESMHVPGRRGRKLRAGAAQLRATARRRLRAQRANSQSRTAGSTTDPDLVPRL